jgi:hypothetical protein
VYVRAASDEWAREECTVKDSASPAARADSPFGDTRHVCAFFRSDDEEYRVLLPFVREAFDRGDRSVHVVNEDRRDEHLRRLAAAGIDTAAAGARGQLDLRTSSETYLRDGRFDQDRMLDAFERLTGGDPTRGFSRSHIVCRMDWACETRALIDDVIEFESRVNDVWRRSDDTVICTYQLERLGADALIDIMRTHPLVIIGSIVQRNPFFVPPELFVPELLARRATRTAHRAPPN